MAANGGNNGANGGNDIVFDCPACGKNLVIELRGAGLSIPCPACGATLGVPIPEGMDITDLDRLDAAAAKPPAASDETLRFPRTPEETRELLGQLEETRLRHRHLEVQQEVLHRGLQALQSRVAAARAELEAIEDALRRLRAPPADETQSIG